MQKILKTQLKEESKKYYLENNELMAFYNNIVALGRMGTSEKNCISYQIPLQSGASFVNGQNIIVDGGLSLK